MGKFIAEKTVKLMAQNKINLNGARVNVLGLTFKEDCPDLRNSKVANLIRELEEFGCDVSVHDPIADSREAEHEYGVTLLPWDNLPQDADAVVIAVAHTVFRQMMANQLLSSLRQPDGVVVDVKAVLKPSTIRNTLYRL
jgi:UDP-N-acetyl-D-galactosamine dehydrogenase